ncbi:phage terminase large subunit [Psychrobacillus sp. FSL K6-1267]|uniref:phage terminase large subunit n=1 Tax=Psychrobacillus sp. FSL K6-1267 TaxID=2921543 RepID=UPI0030FCC594
MAYVVGKWLNRQERQERIDLLTERAETIAGLIEVGQANKNQIKILQADVKELERLSRIHRAEIDVAYFTYAYLSDESNPNNDDNIIRHAPDGTLHDPFEKLAPIHREFFDLCDYVNDTKKDARLGIAAARGHNKSGTFSNAFPLHQVVFRKRKYTLVVTETDTLSKKLIGWVNKQLKFNELLREDFGALLHEKQSMNEKDNEEVFITSENSIMEASSSGKRLRGSRHGALRPDLVIIDDASSQHNENTKEAREKMLHWFNTEVVPLGARGTAIVLVGTMVSATGLLNHVLKRKDFKASFHGAVVSEPTHPEVWEKYCEVYANSDDMDEVDVFYEEHKQELEDGVEVAWPWRWSYRALMHEKVNMGTRAYNSEYRNLAFSEDEQYFFPDKYGKYHYRIENDRTYVQYEDLLIPVDELTISGFWDIAQGKNARSCFNSVITVGKYEPTGHMFVLDEYASKEPAHIYIDLIVKKIGQFRHHIFSVETINAQHEYYRQLMDAVRKAGLSTTRINDVKSHKSSKEERMQSLEPLFENKTLILNDNHKILIDQLSEYPFGDYVDSIDALQGAVDNVYRRKPRVIEKPEFMYA